MGAMALGKKRMVMSKEGLGAQGFAQEESALEQFW